MRQRPQVADTNGGDHCASQQMLPPGHPQAEKVHREGRGDRTGERCRRWLLSPQFKVITLAIVAVVPLYGVFGFLPSALPALGFEGLSQAPFLVLGIWVSVQFLYNFAMSQFTHPGSPAHIKPTFEATGQFEMVFAEMDGAEPLTQVGSDEPLVYAPNWCDHCAHWKPPRTHHCSFCKRCTLRMDHHCPFTGNCIGMKNHGHFVLMYVFAILGLMYSLVLCVWCIHRAPDLAPKGAKVLGEMIGLKRPAVKWMTGMTGMIASAFLHIFLRTSLTVALQTIFTSIGLIVVLSFGFPALCFAASNTTILEHNFPMKEYVQVKSQVYCPLGTGFYNRGFKANFVELLGAGWRLRLLAPTRAGGPDLRAATAPRPSDAGRTALAGRVHQVAKEGVQQQVRSCQQLGINPGPNTANNVV